MPGFRDEVVYSNDYNGNPVGVMGKDGQPVFYIWGYSNRFPIAKIENTTQQELYQALFGYVITGEDHEELTTWAKLMEPDDDCWSKINALRTKLPHALVTTYKYNYQHGVVSVTDPNNVVSKFDYDSYSRLTDSYFMDINSRKVMLEKYIYHWGK